MVKLKAELADAQALLAATRAEMRLGAIGTLSPLEAQLLRGELAETEQMLTAAAQEKRTAEQDAATCVAELKALGGSYAQMEALLARRDAEISALSGSNAPPQPAAPQGEGEALPAAAQQPESDRKVRPHCNLWRVVWSDRWSPSSLRLRRA